MGDIVAAGLCVLLAGVLGGLIVLGGQHVRITGASPRWHHRRTRLDVARDAIEAAWHRWVLCRLRHHERRVYINMGRCVWCDSASAGVPL